MSRSTGPTALLHILNSILTILALAIITASIWFYVQVVELTNMRNSNHYILDYNVYWPQAIPWVFILVSVLVICVCGCGFSGARKGSRGVLHVYMICAGISILALVAASIIALVFADSDYSDKFIQDTVWDAFRTVQDNPDKASSFELIERRLHCCGADGPRDYKSWKDEFPTSCCDVYYHGWLEPYAIDCDFTNKLANERHGCISVASQYTRIVIRILSGTSLFAAIIFVIGLVVAAAISKSSQRRPRVIESSTLEIDSKKGLL